MFDDLKELEGGGVGSIEKQVVMEAGQDGVGEGADPWEEEREWRDPSAHKIRSAVVLWLVEGGLSRTELLKVGCSR